MAISYICILHVTGKNGQEQAEPKHIVLTEHVQESTQSKFKVRLLKPYNTCRYPLSDQESPAAAGAP